MKSAGFPFAMSILLFAAMSATAQSPSWSPPPENARCPSKWGAGGEVIELAYQLSGAMPFVGTQRFDVHMKRTLMNPASNQRGSNEELVVSEIGQVGTQLDGFAHQTHRDSFGTFITRGVLIDVAGWKGVEMLGDNYEITVEDLEGALKKQNLTLRPGDAIIIHTGWGKLFGKDNARFTKSCPGIGVKAAEWLISKDPILLGSDNFPVEVAPNPDPQLSAPVHQIALVVNGVHLLENLKLDELVAKNAHEFAFIMQPLKIQGGTGQDPGRDRLHRFSGGDTVIATQRQPLDLA